MTSKAHTGADAATHAAGSLTRSATILRAVARQGSRGASVGEIATDTGLPRPTIYRVADLLLTEGFLERDCTGRRLLLGPELRYLGLAAAYRFPIDRLAEAELARLAREIDMTVHLSVRSGLDSVCLAKHEGVSPLRTVALFVGARFPLGYGAGSMALLAALGDDEIEEVIAYNHGRYAERQPFAEAGFRDQIADSRARGHTLQRDLHLKGMSGLGVAVREDGGPPLAAIHTAFVTAWFEPDDIIRVAAQVRASAVTIARRYLASRHIT